MKFEKMTKSFTFLHIQSKPRSLHWDVPKISGKFVKCGGNIKGAFFYC